MTRVCPAEDDVFEGALMRLLDPSRMPVACDSASVREGWRDSRVRERKTAAAQGDVSLRALKLQILEILSGSSLSVRWSDPLRGHMGEQIWHRVVARESSRCALTGMPVKRGDRVYRPRNRGRSTAFNADRVIHAAAIEAPWSDSSAHGLPAPRENVVSA
ncbi:DUF3331 domain-containing protein [Paraburkholderia fungorum]|nr:DUF3331 domain-containing protein [Paraburkholderia fungorum]